MTKIKICGLYREEDIEYVNEAMPDYAGFIIDFPKSHRNVSPEKAARLKDSVHLSEKIVSVGVIVNRPVEYAASLINDGIVDIVQLHGDEDEDYIRLLRELTAPPEISVSEMRRRPASKGEVLEDIPGKASEEYSGVSGSGKTPRERIWKAFKVRNEEDLRRAAACGADRVLLDGGAGGGKSFDWGILAGTDVRDFILAGGLTPENIPEAISRVHPWGIDISSGVETDRKKDRDKIIAAVKACREA